MIEQRINYQRKYWLERVDQQIERIHFLSLEGDSEKWESEIEDLQTSLIILWRFDRKLENFRKND